MGATVFNTTADGADVSRAFTDAVNHACWEHGNGGYTGTIAEKSGYTIITNTPVTLSAAQSLARQLIDDRDPRVDDKWGPAGAIPFVRTPDGATRETTVTVTIKGENANDYRTVQEAVAAKVRLRAGERIKDMYSPGLGGRTFMNDSLAEPVFTYKTVTTAPKEKTETRYIVNGAGAHDTWETGFPTQAAARAFAVQCAETTPRRVYDAGTRSFTVSAVTRRTSGEPLVTVTRRLEKAVWTVRVTIEQAPAAMANMRPDGWLFFGWASE